MVLGRFVAYPEKKEKNKGEEHFFGDCGKSGDRKYYSQGRAVHL
jgi:hypothetical protein